MSDLQEPLVTSHDLWVQIAIGSRIYYEHSFRKLGPRYILRCFHYTRILSLSEVLKLEGPSLGIRTFIYILNGSNDDTFIKVPIIVILGTQAFLPPPH